MQGAFFGDLGAVAGRQLDTIHRQAAADDLHIAQAAGGQRVVEGAAGRQLAGPQAGILADGGAAVGAIGRGDQAPAATHGVERQFLLFVAGRRAALGWLDPDLQQMRFLVGQRVEFAVHDALAGRHALHLAAPDDAAVAQAVLVLQGAGQDVGDDLHIPVAVRAEAHARRHAVLVDDAQDAPAHLGRVVILGEGEAVLRPQPAVVGVAALLGRSDDNHGESFVN